MRGDSSDIPSLAPIMKNAYTVFSVTTTIYAPTGKDEEIHQGKAIADAALAAGASYLIFSSLPHVSTVSGGKFTGVDSFDSKADIESYIRSLAIQSAFFMPGSFLQNFHTNAMRHNPVGDGTYALTSVCKPETEVPLIDTADDTGKYIGAILAEPEKFEGKVLCASTELRTFEEIAQVMTEMTGKTVRYNRLPENALRGFMRNEVQAENIVQMILYVQDFGYCGANSREKVAETAKLARGKLTTLEYLTKNPLNLQ